MVLGKLAVLGRPTNLDNRRAWAYCTCSRYGWGLFGHFFLFSFSSFSLSLRDGPIKTEIPSQRAIKPKTTNQPKLSLKQTQFQIYYITASIFEQLPSAEQM